MLEILESYGSFSDQCNLLQSFLSMPQLKQHTEHLQIGNPEDTIKIKSFDNLATMMSHTSSQKKRKH